MHRYLCVPAMPAVYIALASSLYYSQRVPQPSQQTLKRLALALTRKGKVRRTDSGSKRARRFDPELSSPFAAEAEGRLVLIRRDIIPSSETIVEPVSQHTIMLQQRILSPALKLLKSALGSRTSLAVLS
eukprot:3848274-Pleurochrysis_carterae.AAC.1